ncbi:tandem-95 repeat protein, partial [Psychrobacter sp. TAE2020]|uniref:tandem-95 repeat protein n=1 Tax=Psychrobacter sp. TAE2020 TaxID=2846762 RepID=UPI001C115726
MTQVIQLVVQKNGSNQLAQVLSSIKPTKVSMEEGMKIILTESKTGQLPSNIKAKKIDNNLQIADENDNILLTLEDYYTTENIQLGTVTESGFVEFNYVNPDTGAISGVASESSYKTLVSEMISDASLIGGISNGILLGSLGAAVLGIAALSSGSSDDSPKLPANKLPISKDSPITTTEDTIVTGKLQAATDADGDALTYAIATNATNGKVVVGKDGSYTYTPNANFNGKDTFTYTISDGKGGIITQTANVTISAVNDAPVSENSTIAATEDTVAKGMLTKATDVDGDTLTYTLGTATINGKVVVNADGSYSYTPNANFNGTDSFTYTISDGQGGLITKTANITVASVNDLPVSTNTAIKASEDTVVKGMLAKATDADGDVLSYALKDTAANGKVVVGKDGSYTYTPNADFNGIDSFTYTINDGKGGIITQTANVTIAAVNDAPVSTDTTIAATEDTVAKGMLAKATDVDGDTLTYTLGTAAANGKVVIGKDGSYTYTPNADFNGKDSFTYTINDGKGGVITQTATVNVAAVNDVPVSENSTIAATEDTIAKGLLAKATDADGDTLAYTLGTAAANGKVVIGKDGSYTYTPNANFNGTDSFTYTINDGKGGVITQTATVNVAAVNDVPVSENSTIAATEDTVATGMLAKATDVDGDTLTYTLGTAAANGKVVIGKDGSYTYTPNANFNGTDSFTYTVSDGQGGLITKTANITVASVNDLPVSKDSIIAATEDTVVSGKLEAATDVDGDALTYAIATGATNGKVVIGKDGSYTYTSNANFNGKDTFTYTINDGKGGVITQTATVNVAAVNDAPVSENSTIAATEDTVAKGMLAKATDVDGDTLTYTLGAAAANGKVVIGKDGSYTYTPNADFNGTDSFTYTISDGQGGLITKTANITVASVNDLPVSKDSIIAATEDTVVSGKLEAATDVDGDALTYAIATGAANGKVVIGKDGSYTYTPNADFNGKDTFTYTIDDGQGGIITQTATINVAAVNDAPVSENSMIAATEDTVATGILAKATDVDGDTLTYAIASAAKNGTALVNKDGSYSYTPNANFNGEDSFTYTVSDGQGGIITQTATINVAAVNDAPVSENSMIAATEDTVATGILAKATDVDGDTLTYAIASAAKNGTALVNKDGSYSYTPNANFNGEDSFTYTVSDGNGGIITKTANITVAAVNDLPVSTDSVIAATEDTVAKGMLTKATDADGDTLTYTLGTAAANGKVVIGKDGSYTYTPNTNLNGTDSFTYIVSDGKGGFITQTANITVASVNDLPVSTNTAIKATEDTVAKGMLAKATDADGDVLSYALKDTAANGKVVVGKDGSYTYTPNADFNGSDSFIYTINDGKGGIITQTANVTIAAVNDAPVSTDTTIVATEDTIAKGMLTKATDVDGDALTYTLGTAAINGKVVVNADGSYTYTPNTNFNGTDSFTYTVSDGQGGLITKTANITVASVNDLPVSTNTAITATEDTVAKGMLAKATDADGDALTYAIATNSANGKVVVGKDGSYTYTPNADFNGSDSFTYTINDGKGGIITQTANVTIAAVNDAPVSENSIIGVAENIIDTGVLAEATDVDGDTLTYALSTEAANGTVTVNANGSYTYAPNTDFKGEDSFTYTVNDGQGGIITKTANVKVSSLDQKSSFELQEVFETNVVSEPQTVVEKQASSYINEVIEFEITGQSGMPQLELSNGSNVIQGNYSYTLQGPGISASTSGSISSAGSNIYLVDFRTGTLPPGKYTLDLYVYSSGSSIDFKVTESKDVEYTEFTGYQDVTGNIFADDNGTISTPTNYEIQVDGQSLVFQTGNPAASPVTVNTDNGKLTLAADGSYSYRSNRTDLGLEAEKLAEDFYVKVIDLDNNQVGHYGINITSDVTPPEPGELVFNNFEDTGLSQDDGITSDRSFDLTVKNNEVGSQVEYQYSTDGGITWQVLANGTVSDLADGDYSFRAKVTDQALNESFTAVKDITIDATAPVLGQILNFNTATNQLEVNADIDQDTLQAFKLENGTLVPLADATNIPFVEGNYQIQASDIAGNSTTLDFVMSNASEYFESADVIDIVKGSAGNDYIYGGNGDDILISNGGNDKLHGEAGDDILIYGGNSTGGNTFYGGAGNDTYVFDAKDFSSNSSVHVLDSEGSNKLELTGFNPSDVTFTRVDQGLTISAGGGTILLSNQFNQWGVDNIYFDDGTVWDRATIEAMAGQKWVGTDGDDIFTATSDYSLLYGGDGNDTLKGGVNNDYIYGGNGDDILISNGGNDKLHGEAGDDILIYGGNSTGGNT